MPEAMILTRRTMLRGGAALAGSALLPLPTWAAEPVASIDRQWPKVTAMLDRYVNERKLACALGAFGWGQGPLGTIARGVLGFDNPVPVTADSLFRVYSMTKPVTGMAAMILIDEGKLGLDQKLADILGDPAMSRASVMISA